MKIKALFVCFLAVSTMLLTGCKKENYAEKYVGTYAMTMTPEVTIAGLGDEGEVESIDGLTCVISQVGDSQEVTVTINTPAEADLESESIFVLNAKCDETGMHLNPMVINETIENELLGALDLNVNIAAATAAEPVNGAISWESNVTGTVGFSMEGMAMDLDLTGKIKFAGIKK